MNRYKWIMGCTLGAVLAMPLLYGGCEIDSADSVSSNLGINVAGVYDNNNTPIITRNSGAAITQLNVIQDGSRLQMIDNNGLVFRGNLSVADGAEGAQSASFSVSGVTTAGAEGIISGSITVDGTTATMRGTWAEPTLFGNVFATASVEATPDPTPEPTNNGSSTNTP